MFVVQTVCSGNVCRSPFAEHLLVRSLVLRGLVADRDFHVFSAGTAAFAGGARVSNGTWKELQLRGLDAASHRSRAVTPEGLHASDLILAMEAKNLHDVVLAVPECTDRAFTLKELVAIAESDPAGPWRDRGIAGVSDLAAARENIPLVAGRYDIADPIGGTPRIFAACADQIEDLVERLVTQLWGPPGDGGGRSRVRRAGPPRRSER